MADLWVVSSGLRMRTVGRDCTVTVSPVPGKDDRCVAGDDAEFAVAGLRKTPKESGRSEVWATRQAPSGCVFAAGVKGRTFPRKI